MSRASVLAIIPARIGSERLPRKPLHRIAGRPLIEWVWARVAGLGCFGRVVIATDSREVASAAEGFGAEAVMTAAAHDSGTERAAEVAELPAYAGFDMLVNVQGDEPFVTAEQVTRAVELVRAGWDVGTVASPIRTLDAWRDPAVVKVVRGGDGGALYFSRAPIPHVRGREPREDELAGESFLRHVGIYAFTRPALLRWARLPGGGLEDLERLEQLRPLAAGMRIGVTVVEGTEGGVDTLEDAARVERRLGERSKPPVTSTVT